MLRPAPRILEMPAATPRVMPFAAPNPEILLSIPPPEGPPPMMEAACPGSSMTNAVNVQKTIRMVRFPAKVVVKEPSLIITVLIKPISIASTTEIST